MPDINCTQDIYQDDDGWWVRITGGRSVGVLNGPYTSREELIEDNPIYLHCAGCDDIIELEDFHPTGLCQDCATSHQTDPEETLK